MIVEADGRRWHTRQADFERDRRRDNAALALGLVVVRFTYKMLVTEPDYCLRILLDAGRKRMVVGE
jgi:very-short-patch-repair endonuclease